MNDAIESQLMRAYELIEAGKLDEARGILSPILAKQRNNADVWWIYAHSVTDPLVAKDALTNVLRLDPDYPGARELNDQLDQQLVSAPEFAAPPKPIETAAPADEMPAFGELGSADEDEDHDRFNLPRILLIAAVFIIIAVVGLLLASQTSQQNGTATQVANATETTTAGSNQAAATDAVLPAQVTQDAVSDPLAALAQALSSFTLRTTDPVTLETTSAGQTAIANLCGTASTAALRPTIDAVKLALGHAAASAGADVQALGIRALDCDSNRVLVQIGVDTQTANEYVSGSLTDAAFSSRWTVIH